MTFRSFSIVAFSARWGEPVKGARHKVDAIVQVAAPYRVVLQRQLERRDPDAQVLGDVLDRAVALEELVVVRGEVGGYAPVPGRFRRARAQRVTQR